jgi:hypothetical protein
MDLKFGAGRLDRSVANAEVLLHDWREQERDFGQLYLEHEPATPVDQLLVEDLAATMLINSRVAARAATSVFRYGAAVDLGSLPDKALEDATGEERQAVAEVIGTMMSWPWVGASLATKTLHKKRPALIPILDNQAIFGASMNPLWPDTGSSMDTVKSVPRVREALDWIATDITRPENAGVWPQLHSLEPDRSRIELFDIVWWMYFREMEPVAGGPATGIAGPQAIVDDAPMQDEGEMLEFRDDDDGYRSWIYANLDGLVVNTGRKPTPGYMVLHRATCHTITPTPDKVWTGDYIKVCSKDRHELEAWARSLGGRLTNCESCDP